MADNPNLQALFGTYSNLIMGPYREALVDPQSYQPPALDIRTATVLDAADHVQRTAHHYFQMSQLAGHARNAAELAEHQYKAAYKSALLNAEGKNAEARDAHASSQVIEQHENMMFYKSASILFNTFEQAARTAADSSRKIAEMINSDHISQLGSH